jgi:hypothetical protein
VERLQPCGFDPLEDLLRGFGGGVGSKNDDHLGNSGT